MHQSPDNLLDALHRNALALIPGERVIGRLKLNGGAKIDTAETHRGLELEGSGIEPDRCAEPAVKRRCVLSWTGPQLLCPRHAGLRERDPGAKHKLVLAIEDGQFEAAPDE